MFLYLFSFYFKVLFRNKILSTIFNQLFKQTDFWAAEDAQNKESDTKAMPPFFVFLLLMDISFLTDTYPVPEFIDDT